MSLLKPLKARERLGSSGRVHLPCQHRKSWLFIARNTNFLGQHRTWNMICRTSLTVRLMDRSLQRTGKRQNHRIWQFSRGCCKPYWKTKIRMTTNRSEMKGTCEISGPLICLGSKSSSLQYPLTGSWGLISWAPGSQTAIPRGTISSPQPYVSSL